METIRYGSARIEGEEWLLAASAKGIVRIAFPGEKVGRFVAALRGSFPRARLAHDVRGLRPHARVLASHLAEEGAPLPARIDLRGTPFQVAVWNSLRRIPRGETASYGEIARRVGSPRASRAVGAACGANPVPILVPCHRVVAGDGSIGGFGCGVAMKRLLLAREGDLVAAR